MANVKNITDLPLAESAEGLNLIVNDGGFAKQIAASAVGAQADFNVIDENSPAYIKNKPSVAQADWAETDENSPAFVKNKPGVAQPDWNETDGSKAAFIKNKPFWVEENVSIEILPITTYTLQEAMPGMYMAQIVNPLNIELDKTYQISYNSTIYTCKSVQPVEGIVALGNLSMMGGPGFESTNEPFCITIIPNTGMMLGAQDAEVSLSISYIGDLYHTIDPNYIKDMYYAEKIVNAEVLAEITKTPEVSEDGGQATIRIEEPMLALAVNNFYTVIWNGVEYKCVCFIDEENGMLSLSSEEASEIFMILQQPRMNDDNYNAIIEVYDGSESVTISIIGNTEKIHQIDKKYISNGCDVVSAGENSHAEGYKTMASGQCSHAEGSYTMASGHYSHAEGCYTTASGRYSHAEGDDTIASGEWSHAEGQETIASNWSSHAEGNSTIASGRESHAEGSQTNASGEQSHAEGQQTIASGWASHTEGYQTTASEQCAHAEGYKTEASKKYSHAEGNRTTASGEISHAEGSRTIASGSGSHAEGFETTASGQGSHAEGNHTEASNPYSHAEGYKTIASGWYSHAEGQETTASAFSSHAEGYKTIASGENSHAEGGYTTASGNYSHAEGYNTIAAGYASHSSGEQNIAAGRAQFVSGRFNIVDLNEDNNTYAAYTEKRNEDYHMASNTGCVGDSYIFNEKNGLFTLTGNVTKVDNSSSVLVKNKYFSISRDNSEVDKIAYITTAPTSSSSFEFYADVLKGRLTSNNNLNTFVHIVGNGTSNSARSNAHTLDWSGNAWYAGTVECAGIILTSPNGTKYQISVADDGTLSANAMPS